MESSLQYMIATAERFNTIKVAVDKNYYNGVSRKFYLRDKTTKKFETCKIKFEIYDESTNRQVYTLDVSEINLSHDYELVNAYGLTAPIEIKGIVNDPKFDEYYAYDGDDLGPIYSKEYTTFKVWAPTSSKVMLEYILDDETYVVPMKRQERGVYYCKVMGDLDGASYIYLVKNNGVIYEATDPYAYSSIANSTRSSVIDLTKIKHDDVVLTPMKSKTDAIIYEISVRDFSSSVYSGIKNRSKFLGLTEKGTMTPNNGSQTGLDYIKSLGITHVQIMPMYDYATVEETEQYLLYNWGYDPSQYNVPEGSYATNPHDPYCRVQECVQMVEAFHKEGIRVNMDVVFNHVYDVNTHAFERLVPHYYFRNDDFGKISNGSFCSNDINSCSFMVRKYIIDMCKRWINLYHIDGYRFDLMGIIDVHTINQVEKECSLLKDSFMVYGEGWNMPTMLPDSDKAMNDNNAKMPNISFFNDGFRNSVRGPNHSNKNDDVGYITGNTARVWDMLRYIRNYDIFLSPDQSINYCECHDNATCADKLAFTTSDHRDDRINRLSMMLAVTLFSIGIPFIHSGQEFFRTKHGMDNSYNAPDDINQIKWQERDKYAWHIEKVMEFIKFRKANPGLRYSTAEEVKKNVAIYADNSVILYSIHQPGHENEDILIIFNATYNQYYKEIENYQIELQIGDVDLYNHRDLVLQPVSMAVLVKKRK